MLISQKWFCSFSFIMFLVIYLQLKFYAMRISIRVAKTFSLKVKFCSMIYRKELLKKAASFVNLPTWKLWIIMNCVQHYSCTVRGIAEFTTAFYQALILHSFPITCRQKVCSLPRLQTFQKMPFTVWSKLLDKVNKTIIWPNRAQSATNLNYGTEIWPFSNAACFCHPTVERTTLFTVYFWHYYSNKFVSHPCKCSSLMPKRTWQLYLVLAQLSNCLATDYPRL